jgi:hypothetical protein
MEHSSQKSFLSDLSSFMRAELTLPDGVTLTHREERTRRRELLRGITALFDSTDELAANSLTRPHFAGIVKTDDERFRRRRLGHWVTIHGRSDSVRHFFLSAALTLIAGPFLAERVGRNKEIDDARRYGGPSDKLGRGFSFVDIAYNHAGIRFACWLLGWRDSERLHRLPPPLAVFLPSLEGLDLPEQLNFESFQQRFYGTNWSVYRGLIHEIHRHLEEALATHRRESDEVEDESSGE